MCQRIIVLIISVVIICICIPNSKVSAGWPYLTKTQFIEDGWQLETAPNMYPCTFKNGLIGIKNTVWGYYAFIDGWTIRFNREYINDGKDVIVTIEKEGNGKMSWWITDMNGKKLRDTPFLTWIRL